MATAAKPQKEKPSAPRLTPRSTAASTARAAHNATNRNLNTQVQKYSPQRSTTSPLLKRSSLSQKASIQKNESKCEMKPSVTVDDEPKAADDGLGANSLNTSHEGYHLNDLSQSCTKTGAGTPNAGSRPQTPRSGGSSRPNTPALDSRPGTPARRNTPTSRPSTPNYQTSLPRPKTPSASCHQVQSHAQMQKVSQQLRPVVKEDDLKSLFLEKKKHFQSLKKELDVKQRSLLEVFDCLQNLSERLVKEGDGSMELQINIQELSMFNVGDWTADEVRQLCRQAIDSTKEHENTVEIFNDVKQLDDEIVLDEVDSNIAKVPARFTELCLQAFTTRQELIDWIKELIAKTEDENGRHDSMDRISRINDQGLELCEALRELKSRSEDAVETIMQFSRRACVERSTLVQVGESLVREVARLRQDLEARAVIVNEMREIRAENETAKALEETRRQLEEERSARIATKEKLVTTESQLRQTRVRVTKMDRQLREAEASISSLTGLVKSIEDQSRQRELQLEARARKLKESVKTSEVVSNQIAQERNALQQEVQNLKDQINSMSDDQQISIEKLRSTVEELQAALESQKQETLREAQTRKSIEDALAESKNTVEELKSKISDLENSKPNPELPTEREMDLWSELQATKDTLSMVEDEVTACKRDKVRFLESLTKISETDNKVGMQQKLAAELLSKEEIIGKMQIQIRELTKNIKLNEQKVMQYEQYVRDLQAHNRAIANCQDAPNGISYQDLQQEIMSLKMSLLESVHRNDELSEVLAQKEQQLEQQDKTSRAQARVIKVREELINMLKNKETEQSRELTALQQDLEHRMKIVDEVNKQIAAKAEEIQELFTTLENKQQQIHRLEKIVLALEEQQRRAQAQRTRHEEKIAALEHELAAGARRERKFIFF